MDDEREGILQIGELPVVRRRERIVFEDHAQAYRSGREDAFQAALVFVLQQHAATPAYEDTRPWSQMTTFLRDRIMENGAT
jgi:hypothetical protein